MTEPRDRIEDTQRELRARLAKHLGSGGSAALDRIAQRAGLTPDTVAAFARGAGLAQWAATALVRTLDAGDG